MHAMILAVLALTLAAPEEFGSDTVELCSVKVAKHKMTQGPGGQVIPSNGPVVRVYSKTGQQYDMVDTFSRLKFTLRVYGTCKTGRDVKKAEVSVAGVEKMLAENTKKRVLSTSWETVSLQTPGYVKPETADPVEVCNEYLEQQSVIQKRPKEALMHDGFVVKLDHGYDAKFKLACEGPFSYGSKTDTTSYPVWIACMPNQTPKKPGGQKPDPETKTVHFIPPPKAKLFKGAKVTAKPSRYQGECPTWITFTATITAGRAGVIKFAWENEDGERTPFKELKFNGPGTKTVHYSRKISAPKPKGGPSMTLKLPGNRIPVTKGWTVLKLSIPTGPGKPNMYWTSPKTTFSVQCTAETPSTNRR